MPWAYLNTSVYTIFHQSQTHPCLSEVSDIFCFPLLPCFHSSVSCLHCCFIVYWGLMGAYFCRGWPARHLINRWDWCRKSIRRFHNRFSQSRRRPQAPTRAFSWLKAPTSTFTFKTLLRHYAKRALTPRYVDVKLGCPRKSHKGRAGWLA